MNSSLTLVTAKSQSKC